MDLNTALFILGCLWAVTQGDWIPSEYSRSQHFVPHQAKGADAKDSEKLYSVSVVGKGHWQTVQVTQSPEPVVELAKPAKCKVRPTVIEITRSMVDHTSANFVVWPSCVEVQRCSGCCNTRNYKCQATKVQERHVKVVTRRICPHRHCKNKNAVIVLLDHVECKCVTTAENTASRERQGSLASAAPTVIQPRGHRKRKYRKFKHISDGKGLPPR
ncbi:platelet-derived growth factor subunit B-like [Chiloscyllium plagiosum]|uniref:platelet-derived growth factor subunit B-like n=1 Tax=Chiloscyllium plagiosum TaxID=36176 RepID=UPI001CB82407|nr:platelet-derived growth factor subunit B-like [Chiloscyllium plagiosum]